MIVQEALIGDLLDILELQKLAYQKEAEIYNDFSIAPLVQTFEGIKNDFMNQFFLKAVIEDKIIGSVRYYIKENTCYIGRLIVHPSYQNKGIGTLLMLEIENMLMDIKRFELFTGHKSNKNIFLYKKLGYKILKTEKVNDTLDFIYFEKIIKN